MKMKKILFILSVIVLTSCENESIKCEGKLEQETVISILKDEILKEKATIKYGLGIDEEYLNNFFDNNLKLSLIRTTAKNKELKSCECSAQLGLDLKQEIIDFAINSAKGTGNNLEFAKERITNMLNMRVDIDYKVQKTSDDTIVETTIPSSEIGKLLGASFLFETNYNDSKNKIFESGNKEIKLSFISENKVKITINSYDHSETFDLEYKNGLLINKNLPENLKDKYYILEGENLKVFVSEEEGYELYTKK